MAHFLQAFYKVANDSFCSAIFARRHRHERLGHNGYAHILPFALARGWLFKRTAKNAAKILIMED
jgi:hypothetical protein